MVEAMMPEQSSAHFYLNWTKERIDEMDATLSSLEAKASQVQAGSKAKAEQLIADLKKRRDEFQAIAKKQAEAGEVAWQRAKTQLESQWHGFEKEVKTYVELSANRSSSNRPHSGMLPPLKSRPGARRPTSSMRKQRKWQPQGAPMSMPPSSR
jgi:uncharacterized phage infection (PIP) family protein YhgE